MVLPTDDPRRLLYAAARWMTAMGSTHLAFGVLLVFLGLRALPIALSGICMIAGGIMFLICGTSARRHRRWAVWCGIGTGVLMVTVVALLLALLVASTGWRDIVRLKAPVATPTALLLLVFVLVHVRIVWNLSNAFEALRLPELTVSRPGFEAILAGAPRPVLPAEADDAAPPAR